MNAPAALSARSSRPPRRRRPLWHAALALAALALAAAAYAGWRHFFLAPPARDLYQIVAVQRGDMEDLVSATGTLQPRDYVDVGAQVSGQLRKIHVEVGSTVKEGDLLAEIDPTVFLANVDARRAGLRNLRATMLDRQAQLTLAQIQFDRQQNLKAEGATSTDAFQQADAALKSAKAQIAALQAQIEQTESTLRADEANLNYAKIYAPMSGTVVSITARQGQTLNSNQSAPIILRIADLSTMTVQTQVSEADVNKLRDGMAVYFTTLGNAGRRWWGKLRKIEPTPTVTNNVVLYNALFDVPNPGGTLMTSMTAQVFFVAQSVRDALLLPVAAVQQQGPAGRGRREGAGAPPGAGERPAESNGRRRRADTAGAAATDGHGGAEDAAARRMPRRATVKVIDDQGNIAERQVELGASNRVQVEILSGLEEGEQIVAGLRQDPRATPARQQQQQQRPGPQGLGMPRIR
ncbi:hypothetical protein GCM10023144_23290 [Pigmentiphaga soli]|uniref:Efflux RND transporter periplasmic adaptor subunit n=1 Tax=Pigmentiphaga soli TaxID=1007095 RepID=A0ABP8H100_9BURK